MKLDWPAVQFGLVGKQQVGMLTEIDECKLIGAEQY